MTKSQTTPFSLRLPEDLKEWLRQQSERNLRSMNSELIALLQEIKGQKDALADTAA